VQKLHFYYFFKPENLSRPPRILFATLLEVATHRLEDTALDKYENDELKGDSMDRTCGTHVRDDKCIQHFGRINWKEETQLEGLGVDGVYEGV
jgi:hypothetical protein